MLEDLERLADLMYAKFRDNLEREKAEGEGHFHLTVRVDGDPN